MMRRSAILAGLLLALTIASVKNAWAICSDEFVNPITVVAYSCVAPITFGGVTLMGGSPDPSAKISSPVCQCKSGLLTNIGLTVGFWEPAYLIDASKDPWCFNSLGFSLGSNMDFVNGGTGESHAGSQAQYAFNHSVLYMYPLFNLMGLFLDSSCIELGGIDIASFTYPSPLVNNDALAVLISPESILFSAPIATLSCAIDAISSNLYMPLNAMPWCAGSWGPIGVAASGSTGSDSIRGANAAYLNHAKYIYQSHREFTMWGTSGEGALCKIYAAPFWIKTQYRFQEVKPIVHNSCQPVGMNEMLRGPMTTPPTAGKGASNFSTVIFRKRDCCMFL